MVTRADKYTANTKQQVYYTDFLIDFKKHPISGDIALVNNADAVKNSMKNLLLTSLGERPFQPDVGSKLAKLLFEPIDTITQNLLQSTIEHAINNYEPRARLIQVVATPLPAQEAYSVTIYFSLINSTTTQSLDVFLQRVR